MTGFGECSRDIGGFLKTLDFIICGGRQPASVAISKLELVYLSSRAIDRQIVVVSNRGSTPDLVRSIISDKLAVLQS